jgi:hypothetical protein
MRLIICWGTQGAGHHSCGTAHKALKDAGHDPQVEKAYGSKLLPDALNVTSGRKEAKRLTGSTQVPVLILDDGTTISESKAIVAWAQAHPAGAEAQTAGASPKPAA